MKTLAKFLFLALFFNNLWAAKIGDVANVIGVRDNQLIGYGLVVGLNGSGDGGSSEFTIQSLSNLLQSVNVKIDPNDIKSKNTAAVMVTATLPPFARQGDRLDLTISSIGDAKSLQGGTLLMTALKGVDGEIYALGQGAVSLGGMSSGKGGNHPTVATINGGALVEKEIAFDIYSQEFANLSLKVSNFDSALNIQNAINNSFGADSAVAIDPRTIRLTKPSSIGMVEFLANVLALDTEYNVNPKVIIDERTGTIISGINVVVEPVVITHGDITIKIEPNSYYTNGESIEIGDETAIDRVTNTLQISNEKTTLANLTKALNRLGASPKDIIAIVENLKRAGAIHVDLEII